MSAKGTRQNRVRVVEIDGRERQVKFCPSCSRDLIAEAGNPESMFWINSRYKGRVIYYSRCIDCEKRLRLDRMESDPEYKLSVRKRNTEAGRRWRENPENLERARAASRRCYHRRKAADPKAMNEYARMYYVLRAERAGREIKRSKTVIDGTAPRVPIGPFRQWLMVYMEKRQLTIGELAVELRMVERRVRSVLNQEQEQVEIDVVDRALLSSLALVQVDGELVVTIDQLYPYTE